MKELRPGQICTIDGNRYRYKKNKNNDPNTCCEYCKFDNNSSRCILQENMKKFSSGVDTCIRNFGINAYPILINIKKR